MKAIILFLSIIILQQISFAQWEQTAGPQGANIQSIFSTDNKTFYAGTFGKGIYKTTNKGATWNSMNNGLTSPNSQYVYSFASSGNYLFAGNQDGIYRTNIDNNVWEPANSGIENTIMFSLLSVPGYLFAGGSNGVFKSTDNGSTWGSANLSFWTTGLALKTLNGNSIFASTSGNGIYRSDDNASSWISASAGLPSSLITNDIIVIKDKIFIGTYQYGAYISTNNGASWSQVNNGLPVSGTKILDVKSFTYLNNAIYAATNNGVYKSTNSGVSWQAVNSGLRDLNVQKIYSFAYNIFAGTGAAIFASFNEGSSWEPVIDGLPYLSVNCMTAKPNKLFAGMNNFGVSLSDNNGSSWYPENSNDYEVYSLAFKGTILFEGTRNGNIYRSSNYGKNWTLTGSPVGTSANVMSSNSQYLFVGTKNTHGRPTGSVLRSNDNGDSWTNTTTGVFNTPIRSIAVNNSNVFAGTDEGIYRSANNGNNWALINSGLTNTFVKAIVLSGTTIFAGTEGGVFRSANNGTTWSKLNNGLGDTSVICMVYTTNENRVFAATGTGIYYTTLNGTKFNKVTGGLNSIDVLSLGTDNDFVYAGINNEGIWRFSLAKMQIDNSGSQNIIPGKFNLYQNYPNPFNPVTSIKFDIAEMSIVEIAVFDIQGKEVEAIVKSEMQPGSYNVTWNASAYASGVYFCRITAGDFVQMKKMVLVK
jgi:photosystem II stability/assembly factor-like uncharacterized protein